MVGGIIAYLMGRNTPSLIKLLIFVSERLDYITSALDASQAAGSVLTAVSEGSLTPIEATRVMGLIDSYRRTLELTEIESRLKVLEDDFAST